MRRSLLAVVSALALSGSCLLAEDRPTEYDVKAAFLYNFARFVEWPADAPIDTLRIGIVGQDPFGTALQTVGRRLPGVVPHVTRGLAATDSLVGYHILFISDSERRRMQQVLTVVRQRPMLTVSDVDGFAEAGGMIGFVMRRNKIRFQINPVAASRGGLTLSAKLLRLAELVEPQELP